MNEDRDQRSDRRGDDELTRLLRQVDPAADQQNSGVHPPATTGLDPVEAARLRQLVTRAAEESVTHGSWAGSWRSWMVPVTVAAAVTVVVLGVSLMIGGSEPGVSEIVDATATAPDRVSPREAPLDPDPAALAPAPTGPLAESLIEPDPTAAASTTNEAIAADAVVATTGTAVADIDSPSPADKQARTVQFTAPRGTRIIWTLDPNFESPIAGQEPRQEQSR